MSKDHLKVTEVKQWSNLYHYGLSQKYNLKFLHDHNPYGLCHKPLSLDCFSLKNSFLFITLQGLIVLQKQNNLKNNLTRKTQDESITNSEVFSSFQPRQHQCKRNSLVQPGLTRFRVAVYGKCVLPANPLCHEKNLHGKTNVSYSFVLK